MMEFYDKVKSKSVVIVEEIAVANGHDAPTNMDHREAHNCIVAVRFVLQSNYPKYIAKLSNDQLDYENNFPGDLQLCVISCISVLRTLLTLNIKLTWHLPMLKCNQCLESTVARIPRRLSE